jgi:hypothetical protein
MTRSPWFLPALGIIWLTGFVAIALDAAWPWRVPSYVAGVAFGWFLAQALGWFRRRAA